MIRSLVWVIPVLLAVSVSTGQPARSAAIRAAPADHRACANHLNNFDPAPENKRGYRIQDHGSQSRNRLRYQPFRVESDGSVSPFADTQTLCNQTSRTCTYSFSTPALEDLEDIDNRERVNALVTTDSPDLLRAETVVKRDAQGNIIGIFEGLPPNQNERTDEERHSSIIGVRTTFSVRNNTCVPMKQVEVFMRDVGENGGIVAKRTEIPVFITPLCRDIYESLEGTTFDSVFDIGPVNDGIRRLLDRYRSDILIAPEGNPRRRKGRVGR